MRTMHTKLRRAAVVRAAAILSILVVAVTGVTYAILQSQNATLTGSSIQSATADLRIGTSASTFDSSRNGFVFKDIVPGGAAMPTDGNTFYLKDYGTAALKLKLSLSGTPTNTAAVDLSKVHVVLSRVDAGGQEQVASLKELQEAGLQLTDQLNPGSVGQYKLKVRMDADAYQGTGATVGNLDLVFSGVAS